MSSGSVSAHAIIPPRPQVGILSKGLLIAPPEAPVTGYMFGKGLYFADMVTKRFASRSAAAGPRRNRPALTGIRACTSLIAYATRPGFAAAACRRGRQANAHARN